MKKIYILFLLFICVFITGCGGTKTSVDGNTFAEIGFSNGLIVNDNMVSYADEEYIINAKKANRDDLIIEMIIYDSEDTADKVQDNQIKTFNNLKNTGATVKKNKGKNYYSYSLVSNGYYMISSRVDNTLIFYKTTLDNKDTVVNFLEKLGY